MRVTITQGVTITPSDTITLCRQNTLTITKVKQSLTDTEIDGKTQFRRQNDPRDFSGQEHCRLVLYSTVLYCIVLYNMQHYSTLLYFIVETDGRISMSQHEGM